MDGQKKAAFVAVLGRPSVGKSTLVNAICGQKVAIVSPVPQTTRNAIRGIYNGERGQLVFVDTPGRHRSDKKLNKKLISVSDRSMAEADLILYVLDASRPPGPEEEAIALALVPFAGKLAAAINKIDSKAADTGVITAFLREHFPPAPGSEAPPPWLEISALAGRGMEELLSLLFDMAPPGEAFYPEDYYTDQEVSFRIAEIIREKAVQRLREELPHSIYVDVADLEFRNPGGGTAADDPAKDSGRRLWVRAFIVTERESQKGMVVGKGGAMIKAIRQAAQKDLDAIFDWKIDLDLRVKCAKDWRHNDALLKRLIDR
ncbi:MAG: GTPase Era [Treponema sp.]|jgi:GTP-binding protein Era|nr:GTPase Era [Treponema sp.]